MSHQLPELPEPIDYQFQHEDTGLISTVDGQQVEWGFEKNNPRWQRIGGSYSESQMRAYAELAIASAKREPLSTDQVKLIWDLHRALGQLHFARAIEQAHGITATTTTTTTTTTASREKEA